jgi:hypothetical protein
MRLPSPLRQNLDPTWRLLADEVIARMPTEVHFNPNFTADDRKVYEAWMRRTVFAYVALVLFGVALVAALAVTKASIVAEIDGGAIGMAAP